MLIIIMMLMLMTEHAIYALIPHAVSDDDQDHADDGR